MLRGDYKIVIGCPTLRVYDNDIVVGSNNKSLQFNGYNHSTTININGKIKRVCKSDIIHCARNGINLLLFNKRKITRKGTSLNQIKLYDDWCDWATRCAVSVRDKNKSLITDYLFKKQNNYIAHLHYLNVDIDILTDFVIDSIIKLADEITNCKRTVFAPDNYIIRMTKNRCLKYIKDKEI